MNILQRQRIETLDGTFCYELFQNGRFDVFLLEELLQALPSLAKTKENAETLAWIIEGVGKCFLAHHEQNNPYVVKNHSTQIEEKWNLIYCTRLTQAQQQMIA